MAINSVIHTNQQSIDRVLQAGLPVVLVFWSTSQPVPATWEAMLNEQAAQAAGRLLIAKVNLDEEAPLRQRFQLHQVPAIMLMQAGKAEATLPASTTAAEVADWLQFLTHGGKRPQQPQATSQTARAQAATASQTAQSQPLTLTAANFDRLIQGEQPVLVDFWAPWCGPCRMVAPAVEEVARTFQGRAVVGKLNVDEEQQIAQRYQIMGIPALYIFQQGRVVDKLVGVQSAQTLQQHLGRYAS